MLGQTLINLHDRETRAHCQENIEESLRFYGQYGSTERNLDTFIIEN
jgi:hypothetical protein